MGLTTAAGIWIVAAIGYGCAAGYWILAIFVTLLVLIVQFGFLFFLSPRFWYVYANVVSFLSTFNVDLFISLAPILDVCTNCRRDLKDKFRMSYEMELTPEEEEEYHESLLSQNTIVTMNRSTNNNTDNNVEFEDNQVELGNDTKE